MPFFLFYLGSFISALHQSIFSVPSAGLPATTPHQQQDSQWVSAKTFEGAMPVSVNCCSMLCDLSFALLTLNTWVLNLAQFISSIMTFTFLLASRFLSRPHVLLTTIFFGHSGFFPILGRLSTEKEHTGSQIDGEEEMIFSTCVCLCIYLSINMAWKLS